MSDGVLYKASATAWTKSVAKKFSATGVEDGLVKHADATAWYKNYPMEQLYDQYFDVQWTHGYNGSGVKLDDATWGDHPRSGDATSNFYGLWGFDNAAIKAFVGTGVIQALQIEVMFDDPTHTSNPIVNFFPHTYQSMPASYSGNYGNTTYTTQSTFVQTGADFSRWIVMPVAAYLAGSLGGIVCHAPTATAGNSCRFAGKTTSNGLNGFNTRLWVQVLK